MMQGRDNALPGSGVSIYCCGLQLIENGHISEKLRRPKFLCPWSVLYYMVGRN